MNGEIYGELASVGITPICTSKLSKVDSLIEKLIRKKVFFVQINLTQLLSLKKILSQNMTNGWKI